MRNRKVEISLQARLERIALDHEWDVTDLLVAVWARKLRADGHRVTQRRRAHLEAVATCILRGEDPSGLQLPSRRPLNLTIETADLDAVVQLVEDAVSKTAKAVLHRAASEASKYVVGEAMNAARTARAAKEQFERRLRRIWGRAFDHLRALVTLCIELGETRLARVQGRASRRERTLDEVLLKLHARGCLVATEVLVLLEAGHASGALARWRTLHEIEVVAAFIAASGNATAKRYAAHADAEGVRVERAGMLAPGALDLRALLGARRARRLLRGGKDFEADYGWAAPALGRARVRFKDLEDATGRGTWRQPYAVACGVVHAGSFATHSPIGLLGIDAMLVGPTNAELEIAAEWTVHRVVKLTMTIIDREPAADAVVATRVLGSLGAKALSAIGLAQSRLNRRIAVESGQSA